MNALLRVAFVALFFTCFSHLNAGENFDQKSHTQQSEEAIFNNIVQYLSTHSLDPYIKEGKAKMFPLGKSDGAIIIQIQQNNNSYKAMFIVNQYNQLNPQMLYMMKEQDQLISPRLFKDIMAMTKNTPQIQKLSPFHVYIEKINGVDNRVIQKWTFFTPLEKAELLIHLTPDGKGGTYFAIQE